MEIFFKSVLEKARELNSLIHIRYWGTKKRQSTPDSRNGKDPEVSSQQGETGGTACHVIIRKPFSYLEPVVREIFGGEKDVQVVVDRRWHERRQFGTDDYQENRRRRLDRRASAPMLDVLISMDS